MRLALIGDIHGNSAALRVVLERATSENVDILLVTGDLVGYYFDPGGVLGLLAPWQKYIVRGNHEDMLASARRDPGELPRIQLRYGSGLRIALETLSAEELDALSTLPHPLDLNLDGMHILLCHGAPWDNDCYVYPDADADLMLRCAIPGFNLVVLGQTHYPMIRKTGDTVVINPGSVGQPRNRKPGAQWALIDTQSGDMDLRSESYDYASVAAEARMRHPEMPYLAEVLERV